MDFETVGSLNGFSTTMPVTTVRTADGQPEQSSVVKVNNKSEGSKLSGELKKEFELATRNIDMNDLDQSMKVLDKIILEANKKLTGTINNLSYSVHKKTKEIMIKVINSESKEVIREIPPEKTLDAIAKMWELAGILVDEKR